MGLDKRSCSTLTDPAYHRCKRRACPSHLCPPSPAPKRHGSLAEASHHSPSYSGPAPRPDPPLAPQILSSIVDLVIRSLSRRHSLGGRRQNSAKAGRGGGGVVTSASGGGNGPCADRHGSSSGARALTGGVEVPARRAKWVSEWTMSAEQLGRGAPVDAEQIRDISEVVGEESAREPKQGSRRAKLTWHPNRWRECWRSCA